jgi:hypothetical protein
MEYGVESLRPPSYLHQRQRCRFDNILPLKEAGRKEIEVRDDKRGVSFLKRRPNPGSVDLGRMLLKDLRSLRNREKGQTLLYQ